MVSFNHAHDDGDRGIEEHGVLPLTFDLAYSGHVTDSSFPLFKMPVELFACVTRWLSRRDLQALALVDRDCCKLATLSLFKEVHVQLIYPTSAVSSLSLTTLQHKLEELDPTPYNHSPSDFIECVRQITIGPSMRDADHWRLDLETLSRDIHQTRILFPSGYTVLFSRIFTADFSNLHTLDWDDHPFTTTDIIRCINHPRLKHVHFRGMILDGEHMSSIPDDLKPTTTTSSIETISLDISWNSNLLEPRSIAFFQTLFQTIQATVRRVVWKGFQGYITEDEILMNANNFDTPFLPNLRSIALNGIAASDTTHIFGLFLNEDHTQIRSLSMNTATQSTRAFLSTRGHIPSLRYLCLIDNDQGISTYPYEVFDFLEANVQLETLHLDKPVPHSIINERLLPILQHDFTMLTSLQLTFEISGRDDRVVDLESSLRGISSLTTLRRLWLSAGGTRGNRSWNWKICHRDLANFLTPLVNLEILAFSQDTYDIPNLHPLAPRNYHSDYYSTKSLPTDVTREMDSYLTAEEYHIYMTLDDGSPDRNYLEVALGQRRNLTQLIWERWHLKCMSELVNGCYAQSLRSLQWCFVGQLAFCAVGPNNYARRRVSHFSAQRTARDPNLTVLRKNLGFEI